MTASLNVSRETLAHDFVSSTHGKLDQDKINQTVAGLLAAAEATAFPATGRVASLLFYLQFQVVIKGGRTFNGKAGGISTPGGGPLFGDVYTDDLSTLYADTTSFQFNATPIYLNINFFDGHGNFLGHLQSRGISTVLGTGGGAGDWS